MKPSLRTRIFLRLSALLALLIVAVSVSAAILAVADHREQAQDVHTRQTWAIAVLGGAALLVGTMLAAGIAAVTTREVERTTRSLRESERKFRAIFNQTYQFIGLMTPDGTLIEANRSALDFAGLEESDVLNRPFHEAPWFSHSSALQDRLRQATSQAAAGRFARFEAWHPTPDGSVRHLDCSIKPVKDESGNVYLLIPEGRDITERKQAEAALEESEQRYRQIFDTIVDAVFVARPDGPIVDANPAACSMYGYQRQELIGLSPTRLIHPDYHCRFRDFKKMIADTGSYHGETVDLRKDGSTINTEVRGATVTVGGEPLLLGVIRDVSDRKLAERQQKMLIDELEAKNAELERFTYTVSHDLRTPLVTINGFLGMLQRDAAEGNTQAMEEDVAFIAKAAEKMQQLLDELLQLSRIGRQVGPPEQIDLADLAREVVSFTAETMADSGVQVEVAADLPVVVGDRLRLWQVLQNLIDNAAKFMGDQPRPTVEIGCRRDGSETVCFVRDNGAGIDPRHHQKIFGLFDRLDTETDGTGVGLAVVKRIIEVHGGRIWVESDGPGHGSTFCFTIPAKNQEGQG